LGWALGCGLICLLVAIALERTVAQGHGKAVFFGLFVTSFIGQTFRRSLKDPRVAAFLSGVAAIHVLLIFIMPNDRDYAGGLLAPAGIVDIAMLYFLFGVLMRRKSRN